PGLRRGRHDRRGLGSGPGGAGRAGDVVRRVPRPPRAGAPLGPAGRLDPLGHPRVRVAPLRHLVLRRRAPRGPAHPERLDGGRPHGMDHPARGGRRLRPGRAADDAAHDRDPAPAHGVRHGGGGARRGARAGSHAGAGHRAPGGGADRARLAGTRRVHQAHPERWGHRMTDAAALPGQPRGGVLSGPATSRAVNVLAPNASAMTLDGTNTWILAEPDSDLAVVVDPGPLDEGHLRHVVETAEQAGKRVALTLLTHGHPDQAEGAARFADLTGTNVRALDPALRLGDEGLAAGDVVTVGGLELRVVPTPGHTSDSLCFHL